MYFVLREQYTINSSVLILWSLLGFVCDNKHTYNQLQNYWHSSRQINYKINVWFFLFIIYDKNYWSFQKGCLNLIPFQFNSIPELSFKK